MTDNKQQRKQTPLYSGLLKYFPDALAAVANLSYVGNEQHNPGEPLHWDRNKSSDHPDALLRHLLEAGSLDSDGICHTTKVAWRALAMLQQEIEWDEQAFITDGVIDEVERDAAADGQVTPDATPPDPQDFLFSSACPPTGFALASGTEGSTPAEALESVLEHSPVIDHRNDQTAFNACARKLAEIDAKLDAEGLPTALDDFDKGDEVYAYTSGRGATFLAHEPLVDRRSIGFAAEHIDAGDRVRFIQEAPNYVPDAYVANAGKVAGFRPTQYATC